MSLLSRKSSSVETAERTESDDASDAARPGLKGRPTPTRKESEAAARERAKGIRGLDKKAARKVLKNRQTESNQRVRAGMKAGDPRYLPPRDKGPVRTFLRDWIDSRTSFIEFVLPMLVVAMVLGYSGNPKLISYSSGLTMAIVILVVTDSLWMVTRMRREVRRRFPDEPTKGLTTYTLLRAMQIRFMRMPKPQVKRGQKLLDRY